MKKFRALLLLAAVFVLGAATLCGCGNNAGGDGEVYVYNWGEYIDPETLNMFETETGIKVIYDEFETNEIMYPKVESGASQYDVLCPSDYMIKKLIDNDMLAEIEWDKVPNAKNNIGQQYYEQSKEFDPDNKFSVPYCWGTVGILYNKTMVDEPIDSWDVLWDEKYKDNILCVISDVEFDRDGKADPKAGFRFVRHALSQLPTLPVIIQSSEAENRIEAEQMGVEFINKDSETLSSDLVEFLTSRLGFGDFIFRNHYGRPLAQAKGITEFETIFRNIPTELLGEYCSDKINEADHVLVSQHDSANHWEACVCGYETETEDHVLGEWVTTDDTNHWKTCSGCDGEFEKAQHSWTTKHDETKHWEECSVCGKKKNETAHVMTTQKDETHHWTGCTCGYATEKVAHSAQGDYLSNDANHWKECSCGAKVGEESHTLVANHDSSTHWEECSVCGKKVNETAHANEKAHNLSQHWEGCECGYGTTHEDHDGTWTKTSDPSATTDGVMSRTCSTCGTITHTHTYGNPTWTWDGTSSATVTMTCTDTECLSTYPGHTFTSGSINASSQTTDATYEAGGETTYTVSFDNHGTVISDSKEVTIPQKTYNYKDLKCDQDNFWNYINFGAWGTPWKDVDGNVVVKGNQLNVLGDKLFSQAQDDGYKYAVIKYNVKSLVEGQEPKAIVPFHGGGAFDDKTSVTLTKVNDIYEAEVLVDLKCYLYDTDNTFKLGLSLYVSNDATDKTTLGHIISDVEFTFKDVEFENTNLIASQIFKTELNGIDFSSCDITGVALSPECLSGLKVNEK